MIARLIRKRLARLPADESAVTVVELALILPVFMVASFAGIEIAYMATVNMQVSDIALSVADNASRLGQTDNSAVVPTITEADIDSVMKGAREQGASINFNTNGRVILSSLERNSSDRQYIHWQRCTGSLNASSVYGPAGTVLANGMGRSTKEVTAPAGQAVMYAEVVYRYTPQFAMGQIGALTFRQEAAFLVRDQRDLSGGGGTGLTGTINSSCT